MQVRHKRHRFVLWVGKIPWRRPWQPTPVFLPGESHGDKVFAVINPFICSYFMLSTSRIMKLSEFPQKKVYSSQGECQGRVRVWHPLCLHGECEVCRENMLMWRIKKCFPSQTVRVGISPVRQWLRICLSMQGTWVWSLVRELRSHMPGATKPESHN